MCIYIHIHKNIMLIIVNRLTLKKKGHIAHTGINIALSNDCW